MPKSPSFTAQARQGAAGLVVSAFLPDPQAARWPGTCAWKRLSAEGIWSSKSVSTEPKIARGRLRNTPRHHQVAPKSDLEDAGFGGRQKFHNLNSRSVYQRDRSEITGHRFRETPFSSAPLRRSVPVDLPYGLRQNRFAPLYGEIAEELTTRPIEGKWRNF